MMTMFRDYRDEHALVVTEEGTTIAVPMELLASAQFATLRVGQRLVLDHDDQGDVVRVRLP